MGEHHRAVLITDEVERLGEVHARDGTKVCDPATPDQERRWPPTS
jgi:hypothetical protein